MHVAIWPHAYRQLWGGVQGRARSRPCTLTTIALGTVKVFSTGEGGGGGLTAVKMAHFVHHTHPLTGTRDCYFL